MKARAPAPKAELGDLTQFLAYREHLHAMVEAGPMVRRALARGRDWSGADLEAARAACPNKLDFAKLLPEADRHLA